MISHLDESETTASADRTANARPARILDAAARCFSEKGFQATTIIDVADAAGVSRPLVYKYFGGKEELIDSVLRTTFEDWEELNRPLAPSGLEHEDPAPDPSDEDTTAARALEQRFEEAIAFVRERPIFRSILQQDAQIVLRGHLDNLRRCRAISAERTRAILRSGQARGEFRGDLDEEAAMASVELILFGLLERALGLRPELSLDPAVVSTTIELLVSGLRSMRGVP